MHLLGVSVVLAYLICSLASEEFGQPEYYEYYEQEPGAQPVRREQRTVLPALLLRSH